MIRLLPSWQARQRLSISKLRKPALDLSDVRQPCKFNIGIIVGGNGGTAAEVCSAAPSGDAPMPPGRAEGTGLDGDDASRPIINVSTMRAIVGHCPTLIG
jgi:hypothetical protein